METGVRIGRHVEDVAPSSKSSFAARLRTRRRWRLDGTRAAWTACRASGRIAAAPPPPKPPGALAVCAATAAAGATWQAKIGARRYSAPAGHLRFRITLDLARNGHLARQPSRPGRNEHPIWIRPAPCDSVIPTVTRCRAAPKSELFSAGHPSDH
jgi:hypothetical protein